MAGNEQEFKGLLKYFNSTTDFGRRNFAAATYLCVAGVALYIYLKPSKTAAEPAKSK